MKKARWLLAHLEETIACAMFALMVVMVGLNVIARFIFSKSFSFTEEIAYLGFAYSVFFGVCVVFKNNAMIAVDFIVDKMPQQVQRCINVLNYLLLTVFNMVMVYYSVILASQAWIRPTASLRIPYTFMDLPAVCCFGLMTFHSLRFLIKSIRGEDIKSAAIEERA